MESTQVGNPSGMTTEPPQDRPPRLSDVLPTVFAVLGPSLAAGGEPELAARANDLRVHAYCDCDESACLSFHVSAPAPTPCPGEYRVVTPSAVATIGVCDGEMDWIEDLALGDDEQTRARRAEYARLMETVPGRRLH
jgi:hypothetical protein